MKPPPSNNPSGMRARYRVIAVAEKDPVRFAIHLEEVLQELSNNGWQLMTQVYRGEALILTACRMEPVLESPGPAPQGTRLPPPPPRRAVVHTTKGDAYNEVLYSYTPGPGQLPVTERFDSILGALLRLQEHMQGEWPLPIKIVKCELTIYEAKTIPALLRLYAKDLENHGRHVPG
jgi:hypothetical protein